MEISPFLSFPFPQPWEGGGERSVPAPLPPLRSWWHFLSLKLTLEEHVYFELFLTPPSPKKWNIAFYTRFVSMIQLCCHKFGRI